jgi:orotidine-5'-phosphate decarboxylase
MRTSNRGMRDFEYLELKETDALSPTVLHTGAPPYTAALPRRLYDAVGEKLCALAEKYHGNHGYGAFGAVAGADPKSGPERDEAKAIRARYKGLFFLIPGYGAQGGAARDAALLLRDGNGGVVNASRSILKAWTSGADGPENSGGLSRPGAPENAGNAFAAEAARKAAMTMRDALRAASPPA